MKKLDLNQSVSLIANLGVIAGIVFLGYEMRQNTIAIRSTAAQGVHDQMSALYGMSLNESMDGIVGKALNTPFELTPAEASRANAWLTIGFHALQNMHFNVREGAYDKELADGYWQEMRNLFESPGYQLFWDTRKYLFSTEFREFVENEVMTREPINEPDFVDAIVRSRQEQ